MPTDVAEAIMSAYAALGSAGGCGPLLCHLPRTCRRLRPPGSRRATSTSAVVIICCVRSAAAGTRCTVSGRWPIGGSSGIAEAEVATAVVVQRLVAAEASGVMFTADPVTGDGR